MGARESVGTIEGLARKRRSKKLVVPYLSLRVSFGRR
jgi:hypothetical protein